MPGYHKKTIQAAKRGEFINIADFVPSSEPVLCLEPALIENFLQLKKKTPKRAVDSFFVWSHAWAGYEGVLVKHSPELYDQLARYRCFIQQMDMKYKNGLRYLHMITG